MNRGDRFAKQLRAWLVSPPRGAVSREDCPDADRFWLAVGERAPIGELQELADHAASCAACTVAWHLARERAVADGEAAPEGTPQVLPGRSAWLTYAAAAVFLVAVVGLALRHGSQRPADGTTLRATGQSGIEAAIPDGGALPRSSFILRWTPGPAGTRYTVLVTDERLAPVAEGTNLSVVTFRVPQAALAALPAGARVLWQVRAVLPDGTRIATQTFVARVSDTPTP